MQSAKRTLFRQEIRRRQIDEKFRARRIELLQEENNPRTMNQRDEDLEEARSLIHNLRFHIKQKQYYQIYECTIQLKNHVIRRCDKYTKIQIIFENPSIIQVAFEVLACMNRSDLEWRNKIPAFESVILLMNNLIQLEEITGSRIHDSGIIQELVPYIQQNQHKPVILENLFSFLANSVRDCRILAKLYTESIIIKFIIDLMIKMDPRPSEKYLPNFIFLMRSYFQELQSSPLLQQYRVDAILATSLCLLQSHSYKNPQEEEIKLVLEDSLKVIKQMLNFQILSIYRESLKPFQFLEIVNQRNYPTEVKKQALFIIDLIVYYDDKKDSITDQLVFDHQMILKLWSVEQQLKFIVLSIFGNLILEPIYKKLFVDIIYPIRMMLNFHSDLQCTYNFIHHYFCSQKFEIITENDRQMLEQLRNMENTRVQTIKLEALIWQGLIFVNPDLRPPLKVTQNQNINEVVDLCHLVQNIDNPDSHIRKRIDQQYNQLYDDYRYSC